MKKGISSFSLRTKMTLLCGGIILVIAAGLTTASILSAKRIFVTSVNAPDGQYISGDGVETETSGVVSKQMKGVEQKFFIQEQTEAGAETDIAADQQTEHSITVAIGAQDQFASVNIIIMLTLTALGVLAAYFLTGRSLRPIQRLSETMRQMDETDLSNRIAEPKSCAEVQHLTQAFNKMLTRLDRAFQSQKQFASAAAHELKTPLASMQANLEVLEMDERDDDPELSQTLSVLKRNICRMNDLVNDLLAMNANTALDMEEACVFAVLVEEARAELLPRIEKRKLSFSATCSGNVRGNRNLLGRMIFNLLENAVKYNCDGGWINLKSEEDLDGVVFRIKNSGQAIPEEGLEHIFEPFYRVDQSRSREEGGSGLGLAIAKSVAELHGGRITAASDEKETIFEIRIPKT